MVKSNNAVLVTGMSWITALGDSLGGVWESLLKGESGIKTVSSNNNLRNLQAAFVENFSNTSSVEKMSSITLKAVNDAFNDAELNDMHKKKIWLVIGTSFGAYLEDEFSNSATLNKWVSDIAHVFGCKDYISLSTACSSGSDAILMGSHLIQSNIADIVICGGVDLVTELKRMAHSSLGTMSPSKLKAFDERHDGTILGEGAAFLVLEKQSINSSPGKKVYAFLRGCGSSNDAFGLTAPDPNGRGASLAIIRSLKNANLEPNQIQLFNAHGSGTIVNDTVEIKTLKNVFKNNTDLMIFATKGAFGHALGATGAIEAVALVLALCTQSVPPIMSLEEPAGDIPFKLCYPNMVKCNAKFGLSLTLGFGGFDTSLIFEAA